VVVMTVVVVADGCGATIPTDVNAMLVLEGEDDRASCSIAMNTQQSSRHIFVVKQSGGTDDINGGGGGSPPPVGSPKGQKKRRKSRTRLKEGASMDGDRYIEEQMSGPARSLLFVCCYM